jgi:hypothetical protein
MPDGVLESGHWPRFEMATFSEPTGIPHGWDRELIRKGVPKEFLGLYEAAPILTLLKAQDGRPLVCFGSGPGDDDHLCLDPRTGAVVELIYVATATRFKSSGVHGSPIFLNTSLDQFIASVHAMLGRLPFEGTVPDQARDRVDLENPREPIAYELLEMLSRIDPVAMADLDGFWEIFVGDVLMGDHSIKLVLNGKE